MLNERDLTDDQVKLVDRIYENQLSFIVAEMGSGKSVCTLTAIKSLIDDEEVERVLIVAPLKVCREVWAKEHLKWGHLQGLKIALALGNEKERVTAVMNVSADIVVINIENLVWFLNKYKDNHGFDGLVIDELSKFKSSSSKLVKKLRHRVKGFENMRVGLTGTPVAEGFEGLFAQVMCLDGGVCFGRNKKKFMQEYFFATDFNEYNWELKADGGARIMRKLKQHRLLHVVPSYTNELPPLVEREFTFYMGDNILGYDYLKKDLVHRKRDGSPIVAENMAVLSGKLEQYASGFLYDEDKNVEELHTMRLHALGSYLNQAENLGENILIFYYFEEDKRRLLAYLGDDARLFDSNSCTDWNNRTVKFLLAHSKSAGHGLNLASGGARVLWYTPIWSRDVFKQANARLWRRGQHREVIVTSLIAVGTVNELTVKRVEDKAEYDILFKQHLDS